MPPVQLPPSSPPAMTAVPLGVSARRSRDTHGVACDVDDQVVAMGTVGEVLTGVVDDPVDTEGPDVVKLGRAGHGGDVRPEGLGELDPRSLPIPPDAPVVSTLCPDCTRPMSVRACKE